MLPPPVRGAAVSFDLPTGSRIFTVTPTGSERRETGKVINPNYEKLSLYYRGGAIKQDCIKKFNNNREQERGWGGSKDEDKKDKGMRFQASFHSQRQFVKLYKPRPRLLNPPPMLIFPTYNVLFYSIHPIFSLLVITQLLLKSSRLKRVKPINVQIKTEHLKSDAVFKYTLSMKI